MQILENQKIPENFGFKFNYLVTSKTSKPHSERENINALSVLENKRKNKRMILIYEKKKNQNTIGIYISKIKRIFKIYDLRSIFYRIQNRIVKKYLVFQNNNSYRHKALCFFNIWRTE